MKEQRRLDVRKYSFSQRAIDVWNKLSTECVHAGSVNISKRIDKYLLRVVYTYKNNIWTVDKLIASLSVAI